MSVIPPAAQDLVCTHWSIPLLVCSSSFCTPAKISFFDIIVPDPRDRWYLKHRTGFDKVRAPDQLCKLFRTPGDLEDDCKLYTFRWAHTRQCSLQGGHVFGPNTSCQDKKCFHSASVKPRILQEFLGQVSCSQGATTCASTSLQPHPPTCPSTKYTPAHSNFAPGLHSAAAIAPFETPSLRQNTVFQDA